MRKQLRALLLCIGGLAVPHAKSAAQITLMQDYKNNNSPFIGTFQGINFREAGFSGIYPVPGTNGREFWVCSDRGVNIDAANANGGAAGGPCAPTYDKIYAFPGYAPKIHRVRLNGDSIQILNTITIKRPNGTGATGIINPTGFGSKATEVASTDTVMDCANFGTKTTPKDIWGIDAEGIAVDAQGNFWVCEEGGPTVWKLDQNGKVLKRYTPYATLPGAEPQDVAIDTVFKYRKNNRGFEGIAIAPNGNVYAIIQSPILYPTQSAGENTRVHRILEINPTTGATRMFAYLNDGVIGASGSNQIRLRDWKIGDMAAINDTTFLVIEAALRGTSDFKRVYKININGATPVHSGLYGTSTLEQLVDSAGLATNGIMPVKKTLFMNINASGLGWDPSLDKPECLAIINDSTIVIGNDNDYAQRSPSENGIAMATTNLSHVYKYKLAGADKLTSYSSLASTLMPGITGPSTAGTPYLVPTVAGAWFTSMLTAGESVGGYKMVGIPDGAGAYDNGDGTFTMLLNHELGQTIGATRAHGAIGSFVSKWVIKKSDFSVLSGSDLMQQINLWNPATSSYITYSSAFPQLSSGTSGPFGRFCSADLAAPSAFYNSNTGKGTMARIFLNGEEPGNNGRAVGHIASGPNMGKSYELPYLGKMAWENAMASPYESDTTVVIGTDDGTGGQVYCYVGTKSATGNDIEKAGLHNGRLFGIAVTGMTLETNSGVPAPSTPFTLADMGFVHNMNMNTLETNSVAAGVTTFLRPEDGAWDPKSPNDFYFVTTNSATSPSRLWRARFTNIANPTLGGTITAVLDGTEGQKMLDNITIDNYGHVLMVEDIGNNVHVGKVWQYTIATDELRMVASCDSTRFLSGGANFLTQDEEASGIVDAEHILGPGMFLTMVQAHYTSGVPSDVVEGGQMLAFFNPDSYNAAPEVDVTGSGVSIADGDVTPSSADNTNFGNVNTGSSVTKSFVIHNTGAGALNITGVSFAGTNAADFSLSGAPSFPLTVAAGATHTLTVTFTPGAAGARTATIKLMNNDAFEGTYDFALVGEGVEIPEIVLEGNGANITDGDVTPGAVNNTDFGDVNVGATTNKSFVIKNTGAGNLSVSGITFTGANAADYSLVSAPTFPLTIATAGSFTVTAKFTPAAAGVRNATVNIANTDTDETTFDFAVTGKGVVPSTGVATVSEAYVLKVYPNPAGDAATIALTMKHAGNIEISVCDVQGKQTMPTIGKKVNAGEQLIELNTAALANGVYFLKVTDGASATNIRMVVMH